MKYTKWGDSRQTALDKLLGEWGFIHALIPKGQPWRNGIVERSHRTDNENLFMEMSFSSSEERRYQLWLWERYYNFNRPHQGLAGITPAQKFMEMFPLHAKSRMLT
jgi:transposase InsO family protein